MEIRQVTPHDYETVYYLIEQAFKTATVSDGDEQDFAVSLRKSPKYISELDLVIVEKEEIIGHVMLTKKDIELTDGGVFNTLMLAPVCIKLEYRSSGFGEKLIKFALERAKELGYTSVFLCGNPDYYSRFGFKEALSFGVEQTGITPQEYVMGLELEKDSLSGVMGKIFLE